MGGGRGGWEVYLADGRLVAHREDVPEVRDPDRG
jgi:hypothetical protein